MDRLRGSERPEHDRAVFFRTQIIFWLMAATDGHAKSFSIQLLPGGRYQLVPLYDILSTYPIHGRGPNHLDPHKARLAMAVRARNAHYRLHNIHRWHWMSMADKGGLANAGDMIDELAQRVPKVIEHVSDDLPPGFPATLFDAVGEGMRHAARQLAGEPERAG